MASLKSASYYWLYITCVVLQKRKLGPGTHEYKDFMQLAEKPRSTRGVLDSLEKRFRQRHGVSIHIYYI